MGNRQVGGYIRGQKEREEALKKYYENPNVCLYCGKIIEVRDEEKVSTVRKRKYCNKSCFAKHNNTKRGRIILPNSTCVVCNTAIGKRRKYCKKCLRVYRAYEGVMNVTKGELFNDRKNWQSARSAIAKTARVVYDLSDKPKKCRVCGYEKHYEICHVKAVSDFDDNTLISEINHIDNLEGLCPNHHWEFDNGLLELSEIKLITI